jgi:8-oxo-dGTP pyrophosphatase MutT (NUDIX family)
MNNIRHDKLLHGWRDPVATRPAATILLLREADEGLQVLMTRRSPTASFAPGVYVFPGGALDAADRMQRIVSSPARRCARPSRSSVCCSHGKRAMNCPARLI